MSSLFRSVPESSDRETSRYFTGHRRLGLAPRTDRLAAGNRSRTRAIVLLAAALVLAASPAHAQSCSSTSTLLAALPAWNVPLDRRVSLHVRDISLRDALDRVSADARIKLSYASEAIPLDNRVCAAFDSIPLGEALGLLLRGTSVFPIAAGGEHVVLTPSETPGTTEPSVHVPRILDRVVVTGSAIEAPVRRLTVAMNVVTGAQLSRYAEGNLAQALSDIVPGLWVWQSAPTSLVAHYGSIRGTSSFGSSYPKIYVDGIELANPLLITQFTPEVVERIEVIRGPQGAALYGTDAISGVINIVTRHDGANGGPRTLARSSVGAASSAFVPRSAITQDHALTVREGSGAQSGSVSFTSGGVGEYLPGAFVRHMTGNAGFRMVRSRLIATGTARIYASESADPASPLFRDSVSAARVGLVVPQSVQEYTLGGSATIVQSERWTHAIVAGFDGSRLTNLADYHSPLPSASGADLGLAGGNANLGTLRVSSIAKLGDAEKLATTLTFAGENSLLDFRSQPDTTQVTGASVTRVVQRWTSAGVAQANVSWRDAAFLTSGLRVERNDAVGSNRTLSVLPMVGVAMLRDYGPLTVKLRSAYGSGIRPATTPIRQTAWFNAGGQTRDLNLAPEEQAGIETGLDVYVGKTFGAQVTRFDQLASGLIQRVGYAMGGDQSQALSAGGYPLSQHVAPDDRRIAYVLQNVGEITNRGWEFRSELNLASLALTGTFSTVDSRVRKVASGYVGDLQVGDRMLEVPARTGSVSAAWIGGGWTSSVAASRSWDWIDYDRIALAGAFSNSSQADAELVGQELRNYWLKYSGVTRLRASLGRSLYRGLSMRLSGENLLNRQHGEPDNATVVPGRTLSFGLRATM
ncbi:MAG TPA: TonB-dependent receptor [Gemmatimonadaceae bacterium]|nr:TonB-dependent receptor [Gemmatimonadaceae bacterium]